MTSNMPLGSRPDDDDHEPGQEGEQLEPAAGQHVMTMYAGISMIERKNVVSRDSRSGPSTDTCTGIAVARRTPAERREPVGQQEA